MVLQCRECERAFELSAEEVVIQSRNVFFSGSGSVEDRVLVIKIVEGLRELEGIPRHVRRLAGGHGALDCGIGFRGREQHLPEFFGAAVAGQASRVSPAVKSGIASPRSLQLAEDVARAHRRVLHVGAGLAFEAERFLEIEGDHRVARELQQEITQRADGDFGRDVLAAPPRVVFRMARRHFRQCASRSACPSDRRP